LNNIHENNRKHACRLLHCLAVAVRPLRVEELAEVLTFHFDGGQAGIPKFHRDRRLSDPEDAVLSVCSSLVAIVEIRGSRVVQFSHLSVKEYLTSDHLGSSTRGISPYHILPGPAHTVLAQVCLGLLLHLDDHNHDESVRTSPLAEYAARHWIAHAQFEDVALSVMDGIKSLFDPDKPHFAVWIGLFDIIAESGTSSKTWYYTAMGEIRDLVRHLHIKHQQDASDIQIQAMDRFRQYSLVSPILTDIDRYLQIPHDSLSLCRPSDFSSVLDAHSMAQLECDIFPQQKEDLDKLILDFAGAIFLPPVSGFRPYHNIVQSFSRLASALLHRSEKFERREDIKHSIMYLRCLRGLSFNSVDLSRSLVTTSLIRALAIQVKWEDRDGTQDIDEMVILCRELLTSDLSAGFPVAAFTSLNGAVDSEFIRGRTQSLNRVIDCLRDGLVMCPLGSSSHLVLFAMANTLYTRFIHTHLHDDYEEATALLERVLDHNESRKCQDLLHDQASSLATMLAIVRSNIFRNPEYSEVATFHLRAALVNSSSVDDGLRLQFTNILARQARERFRQYRLPENLEEANQYTSQVVNSLSSQSLEEFCPESLPESYTVTKMADAIQTLEGLLSITPLGSRQHKQCLNQLVRWYKAKFYRTSNIWDIEESVKYNRLLLDATHSSDLMRSNPLSSLRDILLLAFKKTRNISYLDESISIGYHILRLNSARHIHFGTIMKLALSLITRWWLFCRRKDPHEAIQLMSLATNDPYAQEPERFQLSCMWALIARILSHPSALTAYKCAMSLLTKSFAFAPTASVQYARLVALGENCHNMPLDYASLQINLGQFEEAIGTLERGRTLFWSELRGFRTPMSQLFYEDPSLAEKFTEINHELEELTVSISPSGRPYFEGTIALGAELTDPFGLLVLKQRKLVPGCRSEMR
jgi:tetratricopeptide (TPR) repeat protein